jgi:hypothetical protein
MLYEWLRNYKEPIINIENFQFREVPSFLFDQAFRPE